MTGAISADKRDSQWRSYDPKSYSSSNICAKLVTTNGDGRKDGEYA